MFLHCFYRMNECMCIRKCIRIHAIHTYIQMHAFKKWVLTTWIYFSCKFKGLWSCKISVCSRHCQYDRIWITNVLKTQITNLEFNVFGLISNWHLRNAGQIHKRQCQNTRRKYFQTYWFWTNSLNQTINKYLIKVYRQNCISIKISFSHTRTCTYTHIDK